MSRYVCLALAVFLLCYLYFPILAIYYILMHLIGKVIFIVIVVHYFTTGSRSGI